MASFKARDGTPVKDGTTGTFTLRHGDYDDNNARTHGEVSGQPVKVVVKGTLRQREQVERVYDEEHIAVGKTIELHWEIVTSDPVYPAVGVLPENVLTVIED